MRIGIALLPGDPDQARTASLGLDWIRLDDTMLYWAETQGAAAAISVPLKSDIPTRKGLEMFVTLPTAFVIKLQGVIITPTGFVAQASIAYLAPTAPLRAA